MAQRDGWSCRALEIMEQFFEWLKREPCLPAHAYTGPSSIIVHQSLHSRERTRLKSARGKWNGFLHSAMKQAKVSGWVRNAGRLFDEGCKSSVTSFVRCGTISECHADDYARTSWHLQRFKVNAVNARWSQNLRPWIVHCKQSVEWWSKALRGCSRQKTGEMSASESGGKEEKRKTGKDFERIAWLRNAHFSALKPKRCFLPHAVHPHINTCKTR